MAGLQLKRSVLLPEEVHDMVSIKFMEADLARSGLVADDIGAYPNAAGAFGTMGVYTIPYSNNPQMYRQRFNRSEDKYIGPQFITDIWVPPSISLESLVAASTIWMIEGEKKAAKFHKHFGLPTIGFGGAWQFAESKISGRSVLLPLLLHVLSQGKHLKVIFDADIKTKPQIQKAANKLNQMVGDLRVNLTVYTIPARISGVNQTGLDYISSVKGVDDWLVLDPSVRIQDFEPVALEDLPKSLNEVFIRLNCLVDKHGRPKANEANAIRLIPEFAGKSLYSDEYRGLIFEDPELTLTDDDAVAIQLTCQLQEWANSEFKKHHVQNALSLLESSTIKRNPVLEYFKSLKWDGVPRLNTWAASAFYAPAFGSDYVAEWGRLLISGIVARTIKPGCQQDYAFILAGPQGIGKTTFFRNLGTFNDVSYYIEYTPGKNLGSDSEARSQGAAFKRNIIIDFSEGVLLRKYSAEEVKSLITRREDQFRKLYSTAMSSIQRHSICCGTTNLKELLHDASGSRRFVILWAEAIRLLSRDFTDQLYAEAYARHKEFFTPTWHKVVARIPDYHDGSESYASNAQEAYNQQFTSSNELREILLDYLNSNHPKIWFTEPYQKPIPVYFKTQLLEALGSRYQGPQTKLNPELMKLASSKDFPFHFKGTRKTFSKLTFDNDTLEAYCRDATNQGDGTVRLLIFTPKDNEWNP